jgi:hypothetical protein
MQKILQATPTLASAIVTWATTSSNGDHMGHFSHGAHGHTGSSQPTDALFLQEEFIATVIGSLRCLLVFDHFDDLIQAEDSTGVATDLKFFFGRFFDRCKNAKVMTSVVLLTSVASVVMTITFSTTLVVMTGAYCIIGIIGDEEN